MEGTIEVDLREIFSALLHRWWLLLVSVVVGTCLMLGITACITPQYTARVYMYVGSSTDGSFTSSELTVAKQLVNTCINIIERDLVLEEVAQQVKQESDQQFSAENLRTMMNAESVDSTEMFIVEVTNTDSVIAMQIANAIAEVAPKKISELPSGPAVTVVEYAKLPQAPVFPNWGQNVFLGALGGLVVMVLCICLQVMLDKRIKSEEELAKICNAPVLGNIPDFLDEGRSYYRADDEHRKPVSK